MFEQITLLLSFVYALALTHLLSSTTDLILARDRVRFSWTHALWMLLALSVVFENWLSLRSLEGLKRWTLQDEVLQFVAAVIQYFTCSLVSIKVPREGPVDMATSNTRQAPVFLTAFAATSVVLVIANYIDRRPGGSGWIGPDLVDLAALGLIVLAATVKRRWVQILAPASILALMAGYLVALMPSS